LENPQYKRMRAASSSVRAGEEVSYELQHRAIIRV
jgi:hypothetical protein